jgi:hypothetical protein
MFKCQHCNKLVERRQPVNKVIVSKRFVEYVNVASHGRNRDSEQVTKGFEIEKEIDTCPVCYIALTGKEPRIAIQRFTANKLNRKPQRLRKIHNRPMKPQIETINPMPIVKE